MERATTRLRVGLEASLDLAKVHWTWRLMLAGMGWAWEQAPVDGPCDVAFVLDPAQAPQARLCICADLAAWRRPGDYDLSKISTCDKLSFPVFEGAQAEPRIVQREDGRLVCRRDIIFDVFWLVTGQAEQSWPKQKHGFFYLNGAAPLNEQVRHRALASHICVWLEETLRELGCPPPQPRWPNGKAAAAGVSHDVDYPQVVRWLEPARIIARQGWPGFRPALDVLAGRRDHWQFAAWVEMEKQLQTRPGFYFIARQGSLAKYATGTPDSFYDVTSKEFRQLFRYLRDEGCEIGLQASYWAYQSRIKFAAEKQRLEEACGQPVAGNRHHYWHLNPDDPEETLLIHEQIGLKYDSSLIHDHYVGWRRGSAWPFFPFHQAEQRELRTLQLPSAWMDDQLFGQQAYNPGDRQALLQGLADCAVEQGGCLIVDIHEYVFDESLFPGWKPTFLRLWEYVRGRGDFWIATPGQIAEHWTARQAALLRASCGLSLGKAPAA